MKEAGKDAYFRFLGYGALITHRNMSVDEVVEIQRINKAQNVYNKRFKEESRGSRETSHWRKATLRECAQIVQSV